MGRNAGTLFQPLLWNLRAQDLKVGTQEWLAFMEALDAGLVRNLDDVYRTGRALLIHNEAHYDHFDLAFNATFAGVELEKKLKVALEQWLIDPKEFEEGRAMGQHEFDSIEDLMEAFRETLRQQNGRHQGGNRWVGTGGTSPYGNRGRANRGLRVGDDTGQGGGGRSGIRLAQDRRWQNYRTDMSLDVRDFKVGLRALRKLVREGREELDLDGTIDKTCKNAGEIELVMQKERANRVRLVLLMDAGGSMSPYHEVVSRLFTAAKELKTFKSFDHYYFHNCIYRWLYRDYSNFDRLPTEDVLKGLTHEHRLIFVGDASMAPWELFSNYGGYGDTSPSGIDWLQRFKARSPSSIWLNPDPKAYWQHPTVEAIGKIYPMYPLSVAGLRDGVRKLRASAAVAGL